MATLLHNNFARRAKYKCIWQTLWKGQFYNNVHSSCLSVQKFVLSSIASLFAVPTGNSFDVVKKYWPVFSVKTRWCLQILNSVQDIQIIINYKLERKSKHRHINQSNTSKTWQAELKSVKCGSVPIKYLWHIKTAALLTHTQTHTHAHTHADVSNN